MAKTVSLYFAGAAGLVVNVITREQLQAMSDFEVNKALAKIICKNHITYTRGRGEMVYADDVKVDYCNTPNDIMPLAFEHRIRIDWFTDGRCMAYFCSDADDICYQSTQPLRAIACCLILVLQEHSK